MCHKDCPEQIDLFAWRDAACTEDRPPRDAVRDHAPPSPTGACAGKQPAPAVEHEGSDAPVLPDLRALFDQLNARYFDGLIPAIQIAWNARLRSTAGRYRSHPPAIQVGLRYHLVFPDDLEDTLKHEMVHAWLHALGRPFGHTPEFKGKLAEIGASRYARRHAALSTTRRARRHVYECPSCKTLYAYRRRVRNYSCGRCSRRFNPKYKLRYLGERLSP